MPRIVLRSPLDPIAAARRFKALVPDTIDGETPAGVIGNGDETQMTIWYYRPKLRNSLQVTLIADVTADGTGSRIEGRIGPPRAGMVFLGCWLAFVLAFMLLGGGIAIGTGAPAVFVLPFLGIPVVMLAIGGLVGWLGLRHRTQDEAAILDFLSHTIDARPI